MTYLKYAYRKVIGTRKVLNTDWPIEAVVYKNGEREWVSATVCNGIADTAAVFATKREALEDAQSYEAAQ
jgi:hypothetical protein